MSIVSPSLQQPSTQLEVIVGAERVHGRVVVVVEDVVVVLVVVVVVLEVVVVEVVVLVVVVVGTGLSLRQRTEKAKLHEES